MVRVDPSIQPSVQLLAQAGNLRALASWLNRVLRPQGISVRVGQRRTGYLHLLVEFERPPQRDRLVRLICHRLCQLRSHSIRTVHIAARQRNSRTVLWSRSIRLSAALRPRRSAKLPSQPGSSAIVLRSASPSFTIQPRGLHLRRRSLILGGSAAVAFVIGCGFELMQQRAALLPGGTRARSETVKTAGDSVAVTQRTGQNTLDPSVTLSFSGDLAASQAPSTGLADPRSDIALVNLDAPLETETSPSLTADRVDLVNLASNQLRGNALDQALDTLKQAGISTIGAGRNQREARRPQILEVNGQRIAYLGYSDSTLHAAGWGAGVNPGANRRIAEDIRAIRPQVDWVIVNYQWNQDLAAYPGDWQVQLAHFAIDQGADLVVGHHPDVLQGAEVYKGRAIAYSLGNFVFANSQTNASTDYDTAVLKVSLRDDSSQAAKQMRIEFLPIQVRQSQPAIAVGEDARRIAQYLRQASGLFEQPLQSPTILEVQSADQAPVDAPKAIESPTAPSVAPTPTPTSSPTDSFIAPPAPNSPTRSDSFTTEPSLPPTHTKEIDLEEPASPQAQPVEDRHLDPASESPSNPIEAHGIAPPASPKPVPIEAPINSIASQPSPPASAAPTPKAAIESPKPIAVASAPLPAAAIETPAIEPSAASAAPTSAPATEESLPTTSASETASTPASEP